MKGNIFLDCIKLLFGGFRLGMNLVGARLYIARAKTPIISLFGGMEVDQNHPYAKKAEECAYKLAHKGFSILTGGGPGIMLAANCGAAQVNEKQSFAFGVKGADIGFSNPCAKVFKAYNFLVRKWLLIQCADGFVILPGGFGTGDEFFEVVNLIKVHARKKAPVVLVGNKYWQPLVDWLTNQALKEGFIAQQDLELFFVTDDIDEMVRLMQG